MWCQSQLTVGHVELAPQPRPLQTFLLSSVYIGIAVSAFYLLYVQQTPLELDKIWELHCPPSGGSGIGLGYYREYTGVQGIDFTACVLANIFTKLLSGSARIINEPILLSLPATWLPVVLDSVSLFPDNTGLGIGTPIIFGTFMQLLGGCVGLPLYWLTSLLIRARRRGVAHVSPPVPVGEYAIAAAIAGVTLGMAVPTVIMVKNPTLQTITAWQFFPFYVSLVQAVCLPIFRGLSHGSAARYARISLEKRKYYAKQISLAVIGLLSTPDHIIFLRTVILPAPSPLAALGDTFLPYPYLFEYSSYDEKLAYGPDNDAKRMLQWDFLFVFSSVWLGGAWDWAFEDIGSAVSAVVLGVVSYGALGPGFFMASPYMVQAWKEEKRRVALEGKVPTKKTD